MDEPVSVVKKKRKYTKRSPYSITVDGKTYRGVALSREGKTLVLRTLKGSVLINTEAAKTPIEIVGEMPQGIAQVVSGGSQMAGGLAQFKAARDRQLEGMLAMPGFEES